MLLFLPGIVTKILVDKLTIQQENRHLYFFIYSFVFGVVAYGAYSLGLWLLQDVFLLFSGVDLNFLQALFDSNRPVDIDEIYTVCGIAVANGLILSLLKNRRVFYRIARRVGISNKMGDDDVWGFVHNSTTDSLKWVRVRDHQYDLVHEGWIESFSDALTMCELFLRDVRVFRNDSGDFLYEVPGLYLARNPQEITLEFYALETERREIQEKGRA